jgi:hypothetical protein
LDGGLDENAELLLEVDERQGMLTEKSEVDGGFGSKTLTSRETASVSSLRVTAVNARASW